MLYGLYTVYLYLTLVLFFYILSFSSLSILVYSMLYFPQSAKEWVVFANTTVLLLGWFTHIVKHNWKLAH